MKRNICMIIIIILLCSMFVVYQRRIQSFVVQQYEQETVIGTVMIPISGQYLPYQAVIADQYWLQVVQYVGQTSMIYGTGLINMLENIYRLSPYWELPYVMGQLIVPVGKEDRRYTSDEKQSSWQQTIRLGERGIDMLCDRETISDIATMEQETFLATTDNHHTVCHTANLPQLLGLNYYQYFADKYRAMVYFRVAALSPGGTDFHVQVATRLREMLP